MSTVETLIVILLAVGAVQGIVFGISLLRSSGSNKQANRFLAAILFLLSYRLLVQIIRLFGLGHYDTWYYFTIDLSWVIGPLIYFYIKALVTPNFKLKNNHLIHFIPLVIQIGFSIFVRLQNLYWDGTRESLSWLGYYGYMVWMNNSTIYVVASIMIILYTIRAEKILSTNISVYEIDPARVKWIKKIALALKIFFALMLIVLIVDFVVNVLKDGIRMYFYFTRFYFYPFFIGISILTYWLGVEGYRRKDISGITIKKELSEDKKEQLDAIAKRLNSAMTQDKLYKDANLNLSTLAERLDTKPYLLTQCLNQLFNKKFSDYVNEYRIEELKLLLGDPSNDQFTLLSLAFEVGFNSKASFNRAVKKITGKSPSSLKSAI
ncbi:helix-turn-helix domain-containing protein [Spongiivirga sp. MCCC 1A20706]|uniref:helix-turn-helix domain-containing protein n=1 Tax=Spongiivirga sp. MCCC 1A20706 TaxID=3160963 RepID=UPI00397757C0